jgi:ribosomal protein S18 acetylase RimI-like enzyme
MLDLMNAHQLAVFGEADATAEELRTWLSSPSVEIERDVRVLEESGRLIGYVDADPTRADPPLWWSDVKVAPDADADEVIATLVQWLHERAAAGVLRVWTAAEDTRTRAVFERLGFVPVRHSYRMEIDLAESPREPRWPPALTVRSVAEDEHRLVYDAVLEVWRDTSDPMDETFEEWQHWTADTDAFDASLWFLAFQDDELAGFSLCRQDATDPTAGYVGTLGVRRPWRRQGLGEALLLHSFGEFRRRGYSRSTLGVDASSPTGATRLYERAGMRVYRDTVFLQKEV